MRSRKVPWWPGSIDSDSGVHLHHLVFGIVTMMIAGDARLRRLRRQPLDRDLRLRLRRRRRADDRRVRALGLPRRRLLGRGGAQLDRRDGDRRRGDAADRARRQPVRRSKTAPIESILGTDRQRRSSSSPSSRSASSRAGSCTASIGFFVFPIAIYGACRIGKPDSAWARRRYGERRPKKQAKAEARFPPDRRTERFKERLPRHRRRQAERGPGGGARGGGRGDPRGERRSARTGRTHHPSGRRQRRLSFSTVSQSWRRDRAPRLGLGRMRRRIAIPILIALLAVGWTAVSNAERIRDDGIEVRFDAGFAFGFDCFYRGIYVSSHVPGPTASSASVPGHLKKRGSQKAV